MGTIIFFTILLVITLAIFIFVPRQFTWVTRKVTVLGGDQTTQHSFPGKIFGLIPLGILILGLLATSFTQVHAKEIGVEVAFGKPVGEYNAGIHFKPFWASVTKINETVYADTYGPGKEASGESVQVRLGDGNPASVRTTIRWHVNPEAVDYIYATYRSNDPADSLRDAVVDTQFQAVVNHVFSGFNPTRDSNASANFSPDYTEMADSITTEMKEAVKDAAGIPLIVIDNITVGGINYTADTERRIAGIVQQQAKTQQAIILESTNSALAAANSKLSSSLSGDDGVKVLVQQCLQDLADGKFTAPAGFSCWPSSGGSVVIPGSK